MEYKTPANRRFLVFSLLLLLSAVLQAHPDERPISEQVQAWLASLQEAEIHDHNKVLFAFADKKRTQFTWLPGVRAGVRLDALKEQQQHALRNIFLQVLSAKGANKIDAIIATEAALAKITNAPEYRNPGKYYTAVFGQPGARKQDLWALRFEGHHLSVNLTFRGDELISATPLFMGANPETIPVGPDKGLRALKNEVDLAKNLVSSMNTEQLRKAGTHNEWFAGFLSSPGERRVDKGEPAGILASELDPQQQILLQQVIAAYVETLNQRFAEDYLQGEIKKHWSSLRFFWKGDNEKGANWYYRIAGGSVLIEQETQGDDSHIHAIWRDEQKDFGGVADN